MDIYDTESSDWPSVLAGALLLLMAAFFWAMNAGHIWNVTPWAWMRPLYFLLVIVASFSGIWLVVRGIHLNLRKIAFA